MATVLDTKPQGTIVTPRLAAKTYASRVGAEGRKGGWIYSATGKPLAHGWDAYLSLLVREVKVVGLDGKSLRVHGPDRNVFGQDYVVLRDGLTRADAYRATQALLKAAGTLGVWWPS